MINVSVVLYNTPYVEVNRLVATLRKSDVVNHIYLIDNSAVKNPAFSKLSATYIENTKNIGYGAAHNIAFKQSIEQNTAYHLVVNADIIFDEKILVTILEFMNINTDIGHLMPKIFYPNGQIQYLCKLIPTPFDLIYRRYLPVSCTKNRTNRFELRNSGYNQIMEVPYLSGCFMFLRVESLKAVGIFDEQFFMYPEDIDLTRRIHQKYRTVFYPEVSVIHAHAQSSYKNIRMLWIHTVNMIRYFNKWGWFFDKERVKINKKILNQYKKKT